MRVLGSQFTRFLVADLEGRAHEIAPDGFDACRLFAIKHPSSVLLKQLVSNELGAGVDTAAAPKHIEYMRRHELLDYCDVSEKGHFKWYPKGVLIRRLLLDYAGRLAHEWGAFEMVNPVVIRGDHNVVGELMGEFHERDYRVDGGRGVCYLRYASDPLAFPFMQCVRVSYKQLPLKVYEEASCFRNEQQGEVSGLKRVRNFTMTDMHAACGSVEEARREFELLCFRFADLMNDVIAPDRWVLGWEGTVDFFEDNREWLLDIGRRMGVPAFFKLMPRMSHYYAIKNEYQVITEDRSNVQIGAVQWDVKDGPRFDIGFLGPDGVKRPCPVIIHASSFGSIERAICAILENIAMEAKEGRQPMFPLWLAPTQARFIPVSSEFAGAAKDLCDRIRRAGIRVDVDDTGESVSKRVRNAEREWIPYVLILGEREISSKQLSVRCRAEKEQREMFAEQFTGLVRDQLKGFPFRPLPLPAMVSRRPIFHG